MVVITLTFKLKKWLRVVVVAAVVVVVVVVPHNVWDHEISRLKYKYQLWTLAWRITNKTKSNGKNLK